MKFVRVYTGSDNETHTEVLETSLCRRRRHPYRSRGDNGDYLRRAGGRPGRVSL